MPPYSRLIVILLLAVAGMARAVDEIPKGSLPRNVVPSLVRLELKLDPKQARFSGTVRIEVDVADATHRIWMHGRDLIIGKADVVLAAGKRIALTARETEVRGVLELRAADTIPAGKASIEIAYDAPFGQFEGAYRMKVDGRDYVATQMEPLGARNAFPGFDDPGFKQPWEITLVVPQDDVAVANTAEAKTEPLGGGWKQVRFRRSEPLPSYLVAFAVGPWDVLRMPDIAPNAVRGRPLPLRGIAPKGQGDRMRQALAQMPAIVVALENYAGTPYPFDKLDILAGPGRGGMENAGLVYLGDKNLFIDAGSSMEQQQTARSSVAHELAHQWFGNLVTMRWWDDLWLNEGLGTWMGIRINQQLQPQAHLDRFLLEHMLQGMDSDSLASTPGIHQPVPDANDGMSAFVGLSYSKAAAILGMFERYLGADAFRNGARAYLQRYAYGNATSDGWIDALAAQSGARAAAVRRAFHGFIDQPGVPFVQVDVQCGPGRPALILRQQRFLPIGVEADDSRLWDIPIAVRYADGGVQREQQALFTGRQARLELQQARGCPDWLMPNADAAGYYRFGLAPKWQRALSSAFAVLNAREQRIYADSIVAAYDAGRLTPTELLASLPRLAEGKANETVTAAFKPIAWIDEYLFDDAAARAGLRARVAGLYRPRLQALGLRVGRDDTDQARALRAQLLSFYARTLKDSAVRSALAVQGRAVLGLDGDGALDPEGAPRDSRALAVAIAVQDGGRPAFDRAQRHLRLTQDTEMRSQLIKALGGVTDAQLAEQARASALLQTDAPGDQDVLRLINAQSAEAASRPALRSWFNAHFDALSARAAGDDTYLMGIYAAGMCSEADALELQQKFAKRLEPLERGPSTLRQTLDNVRMCAAKRARRHGQAPAFAP